MLHATTLLGEREKVTTTSWLVAGSINRKTRIMTIRESADAAVSDKEHIAGSISSQDVFDLTDNAQLGINRSLPAPNPDVGSREKLISHCLKLVWHQEACPSPIDRFHASLPEPLRRHSILRQ
jgi:hypothetical protein